MQNYFESNTGPLFAADFDYFRIPRAQWELMLTRLKQMGLNTVVVTIPWHFHEFKAGTIDLDGATSTRRDVPALLKLCHRFKLSCILQPGPYTTSGVLGDGLPAWLINAKNLDDIQPAAVKSWYKALSKALNSYQWPEGPVIALNLKTQSSSKKQKTLNKNLTEVKWPIWLRKHYDGIEDLNAAYGTDHRTVSDVEFPATWAKASTPLEKDAQTFLQEMEGDSLSGYVQIMLDAGWQIPIYADTVDSPADLPAIRTASLATMPIIAIDFGKQRSKTPFILNLQHPIQVEPDPVDVGQGPAWAEGAPIRADGSVRTAFWQTRRQLWSRTLTKTKLDDKTLTHTFKAGLLATCLGDTFLKIDTTAATNAPVYRLTLAGELLPENNLKISRNKLNGLYVAEDELGQTDLIFAADDSTPLKGFPADYLQDLLLAQMQVLYHCADLSKRLGAMLAPADENQPKTAEARRPQATSYTLSEARHGLRAADAALRKAMGSIGALEGGFNLILNKDPEPTPQPAATPVTISPEVFEGPARELLIRVGAVCAKNAPQLKAAADGLKNIHDESDYLTTAVYQQAYEVAVIAAQNTRQNLQTLITQLRLEIATEQLPLVTWRIHDQVQAISQSLRWGILRQ